MRVIDPSVEIITETNPLKKIELCGRVCYKSEDRITEDSARKFVQNLIDRGHTSVLEHSRVRVDFSGTDRSTYLQGFGEILHCIRPRTYYCGHDVWRMNIRDLLVVHPEETLEEIGALEDADDYMTVRFVCDRAIANELVRHRVFSFSQESTRYVNYKDGIEFIRPAPFEWEKVYHSATICAWRAAMWDAEVAYQRLIAKGCTPQEARLVLPLSTKTELIMTGTHKQWEEVLRLRLDRAAHPQMRYLMGLLISNELFHKDKIFVPGVDYA